MNLDPYYSQKKNGPQVITEDGRQWLYIQQDEFKIPLGINGHQQSGVGAGMNSIVEQVAATTEGLGRVIDVGSGGGVLSYSAAHGNATSVIGIDIDTEAVQQCNAILEKLPKFANRLEFHDTYSPKVIEYIRKANHLFANLYQTPEFNQDEILNGIIRDLMNDKASLFIKEASYAPSSVSKSGKYLANKGFKIVGKGEAIVDNPRHKEAVNQKTALEKALIEYYLLKKT